MRAIDWSIPVFMGVLAGWVIWCAICIPMAFLYLTGMIGILPIFQWPLWIAIGVALGLGSLLAIIEAALTRA